MIQQGVETKPRGSHTVFQPPDLRDVRWTEGFWADKWEVCLENTLTDMRRAVNHPDNPATFHNFKAVAGLAEREHRGTHWSDGDCYKYMEAVSRAYALTGDEALDKELDELIELVSKRPGAGRLYLHSDSAHGLGALDADDSPRTVQLRAPHDGCQRPSRANG